MMFSSREKSVQRSRSRRKRRNRRARPRSANLPRPDSTCVYQYLLPFVTSYILRTPGGEQRPYADDFANLGQPKRSEAPRIGEREWTSNRYTGIAPSWFELIQPREPWRSRHFYKRQHQILGRLTISSFRTLTPSVIGRENIRSKHKS